LFDPGIIISGKIDDDGGQYVEDQKVHYVVSIGGNASHLVRLRIHQRTASRELSPIAGWIPEKEIRSGSAISSVVFIAASVADDPTETPSAEDEPVVPALMPGEPPTPDRTLQDSDSSLRAYEHRVLSGDNILNNLYERPFYFQGYDLSTGDRHSNGGYRRPG
jgi:hypothetical protein